MFSVILNKIVRDKFLRKILFWLSKYMIVIFSCLDNEIFNVYMFENGRQSKDLKRSLKHNITVCQKEKKKTQYNVYECL